MQRIVGGILLLVLGLSVAAAEGESQATPATPAEQYKALLKEYQDASSGGAMSDEERMKFVARVYKLRYKPTFFVIDHKGVIRHKWVGSPGEKAIDAALDKLIKEAEGNGKKAPK